MAQKPGVLTRTTSFFSEVKTEMDKVTWPSKEQLKTYTIVVLVATAIMAVLIGAWDMVLGWIMEQIFLRV